jgi:hypothetical protein
MKKGESEEVKENWSEKSKRSVKGVQVKAKIVHEVQILAFHGEGNNLIFWGWGVFGPIHILDSSQISLLLALNRANVSLSRSVASPVPYPSWKI